MSNDEREMVSKEYFDEAVNLIKRAYKALMRSGWEEGETDDEISICLALFIDQLELDEQLHEAEQEPKK